MRKDKLRILNKAQTIHYAKLDDKNLKILVQTNEKNIEKEIQDFCCFILNINKLNPRKRILLQQLMLLKFINKERIIGTTIDEDENITFRLEKAKNIIIPHDCSIDSVKNIEKFLIKYKNKHYYNTYIENKDNISNIYISNSTTKENVEYIELQYHNQIIGKSLVITTNLNKKNKTIYKILNDFYISNKEYTDSLNIYSDSKMYTTLGFSNDKKIIITEKFGLKDFIEQFENDLIDSKIKSKRRETNG